MPVPPDDRIEIVLMSDQANPVHLWVQSTAYATKLVALNKERTVRALGAAFLFLILALFFVRGAIVIFLLLGLMVFFPLWLVGLAGCSRARL